jgi:hypothetical protein
LQRIIFYIPALWEKPIEAEYINVIICNKKTKNHNRSVFMKNTIKLLGIIMIAVIGFSIAGCQEKIPVGDTGSGTVTASPNGVIVFGYTATENAMSQSCSITTNLSEPNKTFSINSENEKIISGLEANEVVNWTATVERGVLGRLVDDYEVNEVRLYGFMHE